MAGVGGVTIEAVDPFSADATQLVAAYLDEISETFGYDTTKAVPTTPEDYLPPRGRFLVVREPDGTPIGCGGVRLLDAGTAEVKRMYLQPSARGRGLGRQLLAALEAEAMALGASNGVLDTN
ncbi:MAG TPA: GNAT family N-acetyltransferase, partial [Mycobacteriales bacterium]|nr:GNAT family N-acetyltransferase [Mycobacteriales bacterium]